MQRLVDDAESFCKLLFRDDEGWVGEEVVAAHHREEPSVVEFLFQRAQGRGRSREVEGEEVAVCVALQVDTTEQPDVASLFDTRVVFGDAFEVLGHDGLHGGDMLDHTVLKEDLESRVGRGKGDRMAVVGRAVAHRVGTEVLREMISDTDAPQRDVRAINTLGEGDDVGDDGGSVAEAKELSGATEAGHDLVADHEDAVLVAHGASSLEVPFRRRQHSVGPRDRF
mmetsp:Transcript_38623/g.83663  ORF Transcript_38623/g.83663 Transcript_38623/m.83663 type:complete len:225 (+) Transcript_38623:54-728(+)